LLTAPKADMKPLGKHRNLSQLGKYILSQKQKRGCKLQTSTIKTRLICFKTYNFSLLIYLID